MKKTDLAKPDQILNAISFIRGQRVILDVDLARIYGVNTKALNQAVKRNKARFPADFMFQISRKDLEENRSQIVTGPENKNLRSQFVTSRWGGPRYQPYAFTEQGAIMAANVLNSVTACRMSVFVVRAFVKMRALLSNDKGLAEELKRLESKLTGRLDAHEMAIVDVMRRLIKLLEPQPEPPAHDPEPKGPIGFQP